MRQPMVVLEPGLCSLIIQTAPIIFTAPRYPLLIDSDSGAPYRFAAWLAIAERKKALAMGRGP